MGRWGMILKPKSNVPLEAARRTKTEKIRSNVKVLLFFNYNGVVHCEFLPEGRMLDEKYFFIVSR